MPGRRIFVLTAADIAILRGHVSAAEYLTECFYDNEKTIQHLRIANDEGHEADMEFQWAVHSLHLA